MLTINERAGTVIESVLTVPQELGDQKVGRIGKFTPKRDHPVRLYVSGEPAPLPSDGEVADMGS